MASLAEAFSFVYIGLTLAGLSGKYSSRFSLLVFVSLCVVRLLVVGLLSALVRWWDGRVALSLKEQLALAVAGMMRGNVSWAQALQVRLMDHEIASTVLVVVLMGMGVFEVLLPLLVRVLGLRHGQGSSGEGVGKGKEGGGKVLLHGQADVSGCDGIKKGGMKALMKGKTQLQEQHAGLCRLEEKEEKKKKDEYKSLLRVPAEEEEGSIGGADEVLLGGMDDWSMPHDEGEGGGGRGGGKGRGNAWRRAWARLKRRVLVSFQTLDDRYMQPFFSGLPPPPSPSPPPPLPPPPLPSLPFPPIFPPPFQQQQQQHKQEEDEEGGYARSIWDGNSSSDGEGMAVSLSRNPLDGSSTAGRKRGGGRGRITREHQLYPHHYRLWPSGGREGRREGEIYDLLYSREEGVAHDDGVEQEEGWGREGGGGKGGAGKGGGGGGYSLKQANPPDSPR